MAGYVPAFDEHLVQGFVSGDETAFEALLMKYRGEVMATAVSILRQREDAEDVTQQVFLKVYERARQYRGDAPVRIWLRRLTVSSCLDLLRWRRVRSFLCPWHEDGASEPGGPPEVAGPRPDGLVIYSSLRRRVERILAGLPARQRAIFSLRVFEEWTLPEIAQSLGVEIGTVKTHLHRATQRVRQELEESREELAPAVRSVTIARAVTAS